MKIIALEEHTVDSALGAATAEICKNNVPYLDTFYNANMPATPLADSLFKMGEYRLADMDRCGIDIEVLSLAGSSQWVKGGEAITLCENANNYLASLVKEHPSRFRFFATLPWSNPQAAADEMRRAARELGAVGVLIAGRPEVEATYLDDDKYNPVWQALTELDLPIYIHPGFPCREVADAYYKGFSDEVSMLLYTYGFGWHLEQGIQVVRMILAGVFERFPALKIISGHWGELMPYYLSRFDQALTQDCTKLPEPFSAYYKRNVWVTPSGIYDYDNMDFCISKLGIEHLLFSADYPYIPQTDARPFLENAPLSDADKEKFACGNAEKLLHL